MQDMKLEQIYEKERKERELRERARKGGRKGAQEGGRKGVAECSFSKVTD